MTNEIQKKEENKLMVMLKSEVVKDRFIQTAGRMGGAWITSIINAANLNPKIWECEPVSVITAGLNAAALRLSLDPSTGQACILPFNTRVKIDGNWKTIKKAVFVPQVRGLKQLALRTDKYRYINSTPVYEGAEIEDDPMSGILYLRKNARKEPVIGYYAAFELLNGYVATIYMTVEEIQEHGKKYSPSFDKKSNEWYKGSNWVDDFPMMAEKTVIRLLLLRDGLLEPGSREILEQIDSEAEQVAISEKEAQQIIEGEIVEHEPIDAEESLRQLGF